jgi:hypothetical protein
MQAMNLLLVIPAKAGIQIVKLFFYAVVPLENGGDARHMMMQPGLIAGIDTLARVVFIIWIPACAGMTKQERSYSSCASVRGMRVPQAVRSFRT